MSYDFYHSFAHPIFLSSARERSEQEQQVDMLLREDSIQSVASRIQLLSAVVAANDGLKEYAIQGDRRRGDDGYLGIVHRSRSGGLALYAERLIGPELSRLRDLNINPPSPPDLSALPPGAWFLQFSFTLAKPWLSKDDDPFYVAESVNPVCKDKVFKVPVMAASSWKGLLRWTAMHTRLALHKDALSPKEFAGERYAQALLFGDEKGEELGQTKDFAAYLDRLKPEARDLYEHLLRSHFHLAPDQPLPHFSGRLVFYPTFFNQIDVEVINPHSRKTRAGTHPIYLECVPAGAKGTLSLLYLPFDLVGRDSGRASQESQAHLQILAGVIQSLMLTYGFSAKRSSGYGLAQDEIEGGRIRTRAGEQPLTRLSQLAQEVKGVAF